MATSSVIPATNPPITAAATPVSPAAAAASAAKNTIAGNFQTFLTLLTTQLKHQNPLEPLDTNQFTQQLVQFAQVEQQLKSNDQLSTLVSLQQTAQATQALNFVGQTVAVDGNASALTNSKATWNLMASKPAIATVTIKSANGQTAFSGALALSAGRQPFTWNGKDASGLQWPDGNYTISVTAQDANGQQVSVPTEIQAPVDSADLTKNPPVLSIAGKDYTLDKLKRVVRN